MKDTEDCIPMELSSSGKLRLRFACSNDIDLIYPYLRENDIEECMLHKIDPREVFQSAIYDKEAITYTITVESIPIAMLGVCDSRFEENCGSVWMLGTHGIDKYRISFLKGCRGVIKLLQGDYKKIYNYVPKHHTDTINWLKWCGFELENKKYVIENSLFYKFFRCNHLKI